jgi:hypothetical protein
MAQRLGNLGIGLASHRRRHPENRMVHRTIKFGS